MWRKQKLHNSDFITCILSDVYYAYYGGNSHVCVCVRVFACVCVCACVCARTSFATCIISKIFGTCFWCLYGTKCPNKCWNEKENKNGMRCCVSYYCQTSNISHIKSQQFSSRLVVGFAQSIEARYLVDNEDVVGAAKTGNAQTTPGWSTILLPPKVRLILGIWRYVI